MECRSPIWSESSLLLGSGTGAGLGNSLVEWVAQLKPVSDLPAPIILHQHLAEEFATSALADPRVGPKRPVPGKISSLWAVWQLVALQNLFTVFRFYSRQTAGLPPKIAKHFDLAMEQSEHAVYDGLDGETQQVVRDMLTHSQELLRVLGDADRQAKVLERYQQTIIEYLEGNGLPGWIAGKCGMQLVQTVLPLDLEIRLEPMSRSKAIKDSTAAWHRLLDALLPQYGDATSTEDLSSPSNSVSDFGLRALVGRSRVFGRSPSPKAVRLSDHATPIPLAQLCIAAVIDGSAFPLRWLKRAILPAGTIRALFDECTENIPSLLRFLSRHRFARGPFADRLREKDIEAILRTVRATSDQDVLVGARFALSDSKFVDLAGHALVLELLGASSTYPGLGSEFFSDARARSP